MTTDELLRRWRINQKRFKNIPDPLEQNTRIPELAPAPPDEVMQLMHEFVSLCIDPGRRDYTLNEDETEWLPPGAMN